MVDVLAGFFGVSLLLMIYFLPWLIAWARDHHQIGSIAILNLLLGWTVLGWIVSLVWSASAVRND